MERLTAQSLIVIDPLLDSMKKGIGVILNDKKVSANCRKNITQYQKTFPQQHSQEWNESDISQLIKSSNTFILSSKAKSNEDCYDKRTKTLVSKAYTLINLLKNLNASLKAAKVPAVSAADTLKNISAVNARLDDNNKSNTLDNQPGINSSGDKTGAQNSGTFDLLVAQVHTLSKVNTLLLILVSVLFMLIGGVMLISIKTLRSLKLIFNEMANSNIKGNELMVQESNADPEVTGASAQPDSEVTAAPLLAETGVMTSQAGLDRCFICEIMMTAGPRKKFMSEENADKDLGEDVCGFVSDQHRILIWLLDGTSDLHCLKNPANKQEYFSSRLLALGIAEKLRKYFIERQTETIKEMVAQAIQEVKVNWLEVIEQLPEDEKLYLKKNIEDKNFPECATTLLIAQLSINGDFTAYRSGDSKIFLYSAAAQNGIDPVDTSLVEKNEESNDRIFFRLCLNEQGKFDMLCNEPLHEVVHHNNIRTVISFSDGVGADTEQLLKEEYKKAPDKTRKEIIYHSQETGDDKSICFLEIKETS